jgi:protein-S-isoprenylcysteine O-methyltransferase Ste14
MEVEFMGRLFSFLYGVVAHIGFLVVFLYLIGFLGNFFVPKSIDTGEAVPFGQALLINLILIAIFGIQHSVMARPSFKLKWTKLVPKHIERSTYVWISNLLMVLLFWQWQPMSGTVWNVEQPIVATVLWVLFAYGWVMIVLTSFMINHFDLFGTRQVYLHLVQKEYTPLKFKTIGFYKYVRHPLMVGWIIAFWATPHMSVGHLVFALGTTAYILIAIRIEEKDLVKFHGKDYEDYRRQVSMVVPFC